MLRGSTIRYWKWNGVTFMLGWEIIRQWDVHILTDMHRAPEEGNFCEEHGPAQKICYCYILQLAQRLHWHMGQNGWQLFN
jgi:hypothetical protein